jgi:hypothetical protein
VSNYSQSLHRLQNPRVPLHLSRRGLRRSVFDLSIGPPNLCQSTVFFSAPASVFFPGEKPPLLHLEFHRLFLFLSMSRLPLPSLLFPSDGAPSLRPPPPPAAPSHDGGGRLVGQPARRCPDRALPPCACPSPSPHGSSLRGERGEEEND